MAAWNGHEAVVEALIEAGAEVNKADNNSADRGWCGRQ
jgi:ankyrin repeat protein